MPSFPNQQDIDYDTQGQGVPGRPQEERTIEKPWAPRGKIVAGKYWIAGPPCDKHGLIYPVMDYDAENHVPKGKMKALKLLDYFSKDEDGYTMNDRFSARARQYKAVIHLRHENIAFLEKLIWSDWQIYTESGLNGNKIIQVHALFLVMEYAEGETLKEWLIRHNYTNIDVRQTPEYFRDVQTILAQVANALDYCHENGIIHCDVKPDNIMVHDVDGAISVKLVDFGSAHCVGDEVTSRKGTIYYMSPENWNPSSRTPIVAASDQYSLGVIAYEALCGQLPFKSDNETTLMSIVINHSDKEPVNLSPFGEATHEVFCKVMSTSADNRYPYCRGFLLDLFLSCNKQSGQDQKEKPVEAIKKRLSINKELLWGVIFLLGLALVYAIINRGAIMQLFTTMFSPPEKAIAESYVNNFTETLLEQAGTFAHKEWNKRTRQAKEKQAKDLVDTYCDDFGKSIATEGFARWKATVQLPQLAFDVADGFARDFEEAFTYNALEHWKSAVQFHQRAFEVVDEYPRDFEEAFTYNALEHWKSAVRFRQRAFETAEEDREGMAEALVQNYCASLERLFVNEAQSRAVNKWDAIIERGKVADFTDAWATNLTAGAREKLKDQFDETISILELATDFTDACAANLTTGTREKLKDQSDETIRVLELATDFTDAFIHNLAAGAREELKDHSDEIISKLNDQEKDFKAGRIKDGYLRCLGDSFSQTARLSMEIKSQHKIREALDRQAQELVFAFVGGFSFASFAANEAQRKWTERMEAEMRKRDLIAQNMQKDWLQSVSNSCVTLAQWDARDRWNEREQRARAEELSKQYSISFARFLTHRATKDAESFSKLKIHDAERNALAANVEKKKIAVEEAEKALVDATEKFNNWKKLVDELPGLKEIEGYQPFEDAENANDRTKIETRLKDLREVLLPKLKKSYEDASKTCAGEKKKLEEMLKQKKDRGICEKQIYTWSQAAQDSLDKEFELEKKRVESKHLEAWLNWKDSRLEYINLVPTIEEYRDKALDCAEAEMENAESELANRKSELEKAQGELDTFDGKVIPEKVFSLKSRTLVSWKDYLQEHQKKYDEACKVVEKLRKDIIKYMKEWQNSPETLDEAWKKERKEKINEAKKGYDECNEHNLDIADYRSSVEEIFRIMKGENGNLLNAIVTEKELEKAGFVDAEPENWEDGLPKQVAELNRYSVDERKKIIAQLAMFRLLTDPRLDILVDKERLKNLPSVKNNRPSNEVKKDDELLNSYLNEVEDFAKNHAKLLRTHRYNERLAKRFDQVHNRFQGWLNGGIYKHKQRDYAEELLKRLDDVNDSLVGK